MTKIAIIGEAWGEAEERQREPFVGASGMELTRMLSEAGIHRSDCFLTNVFNLKPRGNDIEELCGGKADAIPGYPALSKSKYIHRRYAPELERLADDLLAVNPNLVLCLGNTPLWALLGRTGVGKLRGTTDLSTHTVQGFKVLPTYHPAAVLRMWNIRPIVVADFIKAERESHDANLNRARREIWIEPSIDDIRDFHARHITGCSCLSVDIETAGTQITCIGFAPNRHLAIVIPFVDSRRNSRSYWPSVDLERQAWDIVRSTLCDHTIPKLFQNGLYDIAFLWRAVGIPVKGALHDTMLLHHALQPEMLKGLGFLASVYADEGAWKEMRSKTETIKSDA